MNSQSLPKGLLATQRRRPQNLTPLAAPPTAYHCLLETVVFGLRLSYIMRTSVELSNGTRIFQKQSVPGAKIQTTAKWLSLIGLIRKQASSGYYVATVGKSVW